MDTLLQTLDITKNYGDFTALDRVSISVPQGSIYGLLGPNGAGKTTLIRIINQISLPDSGEVLFAGKALHPDDVQYIGYLPEERGLYKSMKVGEQAIYLAQLKGLSRQEARKRLKYWFDKFEIGDWWGKKVQELSKGMAQKVQFIVTVLHKPKLLIFDEPFSGFDPINANLIKDEILQLRREGASVIFSTHRMESVEALCEHIALIDQSHKILEGKLVDIKRQYRTHHYEVGVEVTGKDAFQKELAGLFDVESAHFKSLDSDLKVRIHLPEADDKHRLFAFFNKHRASVKHFTEIIPSAHDIFIQAVTSNNPNHA